MPAGEIMQLQEYLDILVMAHNISRVRRRGFCYRSDKMELAQNIADKIGINIDEFFTMIYEDSRKGDY
jgi:hypothetical protein